MSSLIGLSRRTYLRAASLMMLTFGPGPAVGDGFFTVRAAATRGAGEA